METNNFKNTYTAKSNMIRSFQRLIQGEADNTDWNKVLILLEEEKDFKDAVDSNLLCKFEAFKSNYQNEYNKIENAFLSKNLLQITEVVKQEKASMNNRKKSVKTKTLTVKQSVTVCDIKPVAVFPAMDSIIQSVC